MGSPKAKELLGKLMNFGHAIGWIPYKYQRSSQEAVFDSSLKAYVRYFGNFTLLLCYEGFIIFRYISNLTDARTSVEKKIRGLYVCFLYLSLNVNHFIWIKNYGNVHNFWNEYMLTTSVLKGRSARLAEESEEHLRRQKGFERKCSFAMGGAIVCVGFPALLRAAKVLIKPESPELVSSAFSNPRGLPLLAKLGLALLQLNLTGFHGYYMTTTACTIISYIFFCLPILHDLVLEDSKTSLEWRNFGTGLEVHGIYTRLVTLQTCYNGFFSLWPLMTEVSGVVTSITRFFLALKLGTPQDFLAGTLVIITLSVIFLGFAEVHGKSEEALKSWMRIRSPGWFPRYLKSCKSMSISIGGFYYADKSLILTMISIVVTNTTSLALTFGDIRRGQ